MRLEHKIALITGASSGIGAGIAARFAREGAFVAVNYRSDREASAAARVVAACGPRAVALRADVTRRDEVQAMVDRVLAEWGRLDVVVNNAGIEVDRPFLEATDEEWQRVIAVNLYGPYVVTQCAARAMVAKAEGGRVVNISSVHEDIPFAGYTSYCASKGGLRMMTRTLALELAPHRITVNGIAPGAIATPINQDVLDDPASRRAALGEIPLDRFGTPDDVAAVATFLASDEAGYVTGSTYYVDGGLAQQVTKY